MTNVQKHSTMRHLFQCLLSGISGKNISGTILFTTGVILLLLKSWIWEFILTSMLTIKPNSFFTDAWLKIPNISTDVYLFNWSNPEHLMNISVKPKFEQVGPYRYRQTIEKSQVVWNSNNTVTYRIKRTLYYNEKEMNEKLHYNITSLNVVNLFAAHYIRNWNYFIKKAYSTYLMAVTPNVHLTVTADKMLNKGLDSFLVDIFNHLPFIAPDIPRFDKFGLVAMINNTDIFGGVYNMANGLNRNFDILKWNYRNTSNFFDGSCANVQGSAGELFSRKIGKSKIFLFVGETCRSIQLDFEKEVYVNGILGYKYILGENALDNGTLISENTCYCAGECLPSGVINMTSCTYGLPVFASVAHFYKADPTYLDAVEGLHPDKDKHEFYVIIEPHTSVVLNVSVAIQLNIFLQPIEDIGLFQYVRKIVFPIAWVNLQGSLPNKEFICLKIYLLLPCITIGMSVTFVALGLYLQFFDLLRTKFLHLHRKIRQKSYINGLMLQRKKNTFKTYIDEEEMQLFSNNSNAFN